jgi:16S rRNA (guanine527-N7)-methyltransferase
MEGVLEQGLARLGLPRSGRETGLLQAYAAQVELWNRRANLVRAGGEELLVRHLLDSLAPARLVERWAAGGPVADVGSGAGLPGIPLAIVLPGLRFALIERAALRAAFLRACAAVLALGNVEVLEADVGDLTKSAFPLVIFRAFRPLARAVDEVAPIVAAAGAIAAYAGRREPIDAQIGEIPGDFRVSQIVRVEVPFLDAERHVVVLARTGGGKG